MSDTQTTSAVTDVALLEQLDPAAREVAVTGMLAQARQWLERAKESTTPAQDVAEFKAFVATVAEAAKQKKLSEAIQLDAVEMVRRSERALGIAIREGQANGEIESVPEARIRATLTRDVGMGRADQIGLTDLIKPKPTDFAPAHELSGVHGAGIYKMTDNVTDEQFESAVAEAKEEGNLSRANVVRKVAEISSYREQQSDKWSRVTDLADQGYTSDQIAAEVGMTEAGLRNGTRKRNITVRADKIIGKTHRINPIEVLGKIVLSLEVTQSSLELVSYEDVTPEQAAEWLEQLAEPLRAIRRMQTALKEIK